jgi:hypothetical protein
MGVRDKIKGKVAYGSDGLPRALTAEERATLQAGAPASNGAILARLEGKLDRLTDVVVELVNALVDQSEVDRTPPAATDTEKAAPEVGRFLRNPVV